MSRASFLKTIQVTIMGTWIVFTAIFFHVRFTAMVYDQYQAQIAPALARFHVINPAADGMKHDGAPAR